MWAEQNETEDTICGDSRYWENVVGAEWKALDVAFLRSVTVTMVND